MNKTDSLVAATIAKDPKDMKPSQDAGMNAAMVAIMASDPIDPYGANVAAAAMGPMPTIRIQIEPVVAEVLPDVPTAPEPVGDMWAIQYPFWGVTCKCWLWNVSAYRTLKQAQEQLPKERPEARIIFIPGGAA